MVWNETVIGWNPVLDENVIGCTHFWMKVSLDEPVFGWKCFWMSFFFFCNLDESVRTLSVVHFLISGFLKSAGVAPLPPCYHTFLNETVKTVAVFLVLTTSRLWWQMHLVGFVMHERLSLQQMAKWRNLPGVVHWGLHVVVPRVHGFYGGLLLFRCLAHTFVCSLSPVFSAWHCVHPLLSVVATEIP